MSRVVGIWLFPPKLSQRRVIIVDSWNCQIMEEFLFFRLDTITLQITSFRIKSRLLENG